MSKPQAQNQSDPQLVIVPDPQTEREGTIGYRPFKEQELFLEAFQLDQKGQPASKDNKTEFELREKIVGGSKDVTICAAPGSCVSKGGTFADQQRVVKGASYDVEKRFTTANGQSVRVYDAKKKESFDYVVVHASYEGGFKYEYRNDPR